MKKEEQHDITSLYEELAISALQGENLEPWLRLERPVGKLAATSLDLGAAVFDLALWIETARPHHLTPSMKEDTFEALKTAIKRYGLVDGAIYINERGHVVDGYHRMKAIYELLKEGLSLAAPEVRFVRFASEQDELAFVLLLNVTRRMIDDDEMEEVLKAILRSGHDGTDNWLSDLCGLGPDTVRDVRAMLENLPLEEGGIEYLPKRRSEAGKVYKQKRIEPATQKRRDEAGLKSKANKAEAGSGEGHNGDVLPAERASIASNPATSTIAPPNVVKVDNNKAPRNEQVPEAEDAALPVLEETDASDELKLLVKDWWKQFQFLPTMSKELAEMEAKREGREPEKKDADRLTRSLKAYVGKRISGHLVLHRTMSAGVAVFMLAPAIEEGRAILDWEVLIAKAATKK